MRALVLLFLFMNTLVVLAQDYPRNTIDPAALTDDLGGFQDNDINYEDLYENYVQLYANPINLNSASPSALRMLNILSETQIQNLLDHIREHGNLISVYELQAVPEFDLATVYKIIPFVFVEDPEAKLNTRFLKRIINNDNSYFVTRYSRTLQKSAGYKDPENPDHAFRGSPDRVYIRFRTSKPDDFSFVLRHQIVSYTGSIIGGQRIS